MIECETRVFRDTAIRGISEIAPQGLFIEPAPERFLEGPTCFARTRLQGKIASGAKQDFSTKPFGVLSNLSRDSLLGSPGANLLTDG